MSNFRLRFCGYRRAYISQQIIGRLFVRTYNSRWTFDLEDLNSVCLRSESIEIDMNWPKYRSLSESHLKLTDAI